MNTLRTHPDLIGSVSPLSWGLKDILQYTEVVLNRDDVDAKADALLQYINQRVVDQTTEVNRQDITVRNFQELGRWFDMDLERWRNPIAPSGRPTTMRQFARSTTASTTSARGTRVSSARTRTALIYLGANSWTERST